MRATGDSQGELVLPKITEEDIQEIERRWKMLFDPPRRAIMRSNDSFDVLACPGSGKTTLLVAKLSILGKKWSHSRRGICVLSHTNVARQELEVKLSGTGGGEMLLDYPHFVGTIHNFFNTFLALPLIRSEGRPFKLIDDDVCFNWMKRFLLAKPARFGLGQLVHKVRTLDSYIHGLVCSDNPDFLAAPEGLDDKAWRTLKNAKKIAMDRGFYYHADMLAMTERLLREQPQVVAFIRWRFPVVLLDETQDTSELQSRMLSQIFPIEECLLRQRFGDSNQAIYDRGQDRATTDPFPGPDIRWITNSQRFDQSIASKAEPLAPDQSQSNLIGAGPPKTYFPDLSDKGPFPHTVFLFKEGSETMVLPSFAELLLKVFPPETLRSEKFLARAIGFVGKSGVNVEEEGAKLPRSLCDYWPAYEPRVAKFEPRPDKLADFIHLAQRQRAAMADCATAASTIARGIMELIEIVVPSAVTGNERTLRRVRDLLVTDRSASRVLEGLLWKWCVEVEPLSDADWRSQLLELRKALV